MVIAKRQLSMLAIKTMTAEAVVPWRANAVTPPIAQGLDNFMKYRIVCVHRTTFPHRHMVRWVKARRANIADRACQLFFTIDAIERT